MPRIARGLPIGDRKGVKSSATTVRRLVISLETVETRDDQEVTQGEEDTMTEVVIEGAMEAVGTTEDQEVEGLDPVLRVAEEPITMTEREDHPETDQDQDRREDLRVETDQRRSKTEEVTEETIEEMIEEATEEREEVIVLQTRPNKEREVTEIPSELVERRDIVSN